MASVTDLISIVDADPDLADLLDGDELARARREALTRERRLAPGDWDSAGAIEPDTHQCDRCRNDPDRLGHPSGEPCHDEAGADDQGALHDPVVPREGLSRAEQDEAEARMDPPVVVEHVEVAAHDEGKHGDDREGDRDRDAGSRASQVRRQRQDGDSEDPPELQAPTHANECTGERSTALPVAMRAATTAS